jgi:hypothetical protein
LPRLIFHALSAENAVPEPETRVATPEDVLIAMTEVHAVKAVESVLIARNENLLVVLTVGLKLAW